MKTGRRQFLSLGTSLVACGTSSISRAAEGAPAVPGTDLPLIVSTWPFGKPANEAALAAILAGGSLLDGVEQGIHVPELDAGNKSVGLGGLPNDAGVVQLDACIMSGPGHRAGSVAALEGIVHPISAARRVMEKTPHVMLVGEGARMFALEQGLASRPNDTAAAYEAWRKKRAEKAAVNPRRRKITIPSPCSSLARMGIFVGAAPPAAGAASCLDGWETPPSSAAGCMWIMKSGPPEPPASGKM